MTVYPRSVHVCDNVTYAIAEDGERDVLLVNDEARELNHESACLLRSLFPFTAPVPVLHCARSIGVGDRLGIACPGHIRVFEKYDAMPVFAQQSIRELDLTNRTYEDVLDCVTFAVFRENFTRGFAADGDHLKKPEDIEYALSLGFSMITLDLSEHIHADAKGEYSQDVDALYLGKTFAVEDNVISFTGENLAAAKGIYGEALDFAVDMYDRFLRNGRYNAQLEISIDETATPTKPEDHFFVASELIRRGVQCATIAPRFIGEFQKGIDYIGDPALFDAEMAVHAAIARHFGYKISVHSGSDKFAIFPSVGNRTQQRYHVKTAGTNWLEAMKIVSVHAPALYREVHAFALTAFDEATKYYHVTTDLTKIPALDTLTDAQLPDLFKNNDARQLIHITYGLILNAKNADGSLRFRDRLYKLWREHAGEYAAALEEHIGHHLEQLGCPKI